MVKSRLSRRSILRSNSTAGPFFLVDAFADGKRNNVDHAIDLLAVCVRCRFLARDIKPELDPWAPTFYVFLIGPRPSASLARGEEGGGSAQTTVVALWAPFARERWYPTRGTLQREED